MRKQNNKQALYESIMQKISPIVKNSLNEGYSGIDVGSSEFIYYNIEGGDVYFETSESLPKILKFHDYKMSEIKKVLALKELETHELLCCGDITGVVLRIYEPGL